MKGLLKNAQGALRKMDFLEMCSLPEAARMLAEENRMHGLQTACCTKPLLIFIEQIL